MRSLSIISEVEQASQILLTPSPTALTLYYRLDTCTYGYGFKCLALSFIDRGILRVDTRAVGQMKFTLYLQVLKSRQYTNHLYLKSIKNWLSM